MKFFFLFFLTLIVVDARAIIPMMFIPQPTYTSYNVWQGTISTDWQVAGNWSLGHIPKLGETAVFDSTCTTCNVSMSSAVTAPDVKIQSSYTGTINQGGTLFTVNGSWDQAGGTFQGSSAGVNFARSFWMEGGTFSAGTGTVNYNYNWNVVAGGNYDLQSATVNTVGAFTFRNANVTATSGTWTFTNCYFVFDVGTVFANHSGKIVLKRTTTGTTFPADYVGVQLYDLVLSSTATGNYSNYSLQSLITVAHNLYIDSADPTYMVNTYSFGYNVYGNVVITGYGGQSSNLVKLMGSNPQIDGTGTTTPNSFGIQLGAAQTATWLGSPLVNGTFNCVTSTSIVSNGNFSVSTNGVFDCTLTGSSNITFNGTSTTNILSGAGSAGISSITIAKTGGGYLTQSSNLTTTGAGNSFHVASGSLLMNGKNLTIAGTLTVDSGATITKGGGTLTAGTTVNNGTIN